VTKNALREEIRRALRATDAESREAASARIRAEIGALPEWRAARMVCAFVPLGSEPQIQPLWQGGAGPAFCFPRLRGSEPELIRIDDRAELHRAHWKLDAPEFAGAPVVPLAEVDVILVPGVAFTREGHRLGRGGGFYDRLLAALPARTRRIGVCYEAQLLDALPTEPHDQRVDAVITGA
jgi:5-formyltetrahydrofolate cyclo-ligase